MTNHKHRRIIKDANPNAVLGSLGFIGLFILLSYVGCSLVSCQKESSFTSQQKPVIESDHHLKPAEGWNYNNRPESFDLWEAARKGGNGKGKGGGKPPKDTTTQEPPTDEPDEPQDPQPPTYNGQGVILVDFDGQYVAGTPWNVNGGFYCKPANQTGEEQAAILARIQSDFAEFAVTVTSDSTLYHAANPYKRQRVIITESWEWFGQAGGVAYVGSFTWGGENPCFVFNSLLGYNVKYVADAASHEAGHTLNLRHQGKCDGTQYNPDLAADGKGYLMGYPYNYPSGWQVGVTPYCSPQDDKAIITQTLPYKPSGVAYITRQQLEETMKTMSR